MTPGMQFRLWLRGASRGQVGGTVAVVAAVLALLLGSVSQGSTKAADDAGFSSLDGGSPAVSGTTGGSTSTTGALPSTQTPVTPGGAGSGGTSGTTGTSFGTTGGTTATGTTGTTAPGTSTAGTPGAPAFDLTKATDRGINNCSGVKTCVKLGVLIAKIGGLDQSGFALNLRGDIVQVVTAFINDQNKRGGLNGRPIVPVFRDTDPIDENDQNQACTQFTQDDKVFAVLDTAAFIFANPQKCFTVTNRTPYIHGYAESEAFMDAGLGLDVSETRSLDRIAIEWADEMGKLGFLKGGEKVGILEDNCEPSHSVVDKYLVTGIKKLKVASVKTYASDCSAAYAQSQPPALMQQMCVDGVTHVVLATSFVAAQTFLQAADGSPCGTGPAKFTYMASDYSLLAGDLFTRNFSKTQFDGSLAITNFYTGITKGSARQAACSKILVAAGLPGLNNTYPNADANAFCDYFAIFVKASLATGPNLTRVGWAKAVQNLGVYEGAFSPRSDFRPGKTSGGELVHAMIWHADCTCYRQSGPLHTGVG